jgi:hypothetical protein
MQSAMLSRCLVAAALLLARATPALADEPWIIEAGPEAADAAKAGASAVAQAQKLGKKKQYLEAVTLLEDTARRWPSAVHDCNLSLAYLRAGALTRAQLLWDVAGLRNAARPTWCTGPMVQQLSTALRAAGFVPLTINTVPPDAVIQVGGVTTRGVHVVWLPAGRHVVSVTAAGHEAGRAEVDVAAPTASVTITLAVEGAAKAEEPSAPAPEPAPAPAPEPAPMPIADPVVTAPAPRREPTLWPAWVAAGAGGGARITAAIFHISAIDARDDADRRYRIHPAFDDARDRFARDRAIAITGYAVGAAALGVAAWWYLGHAGSGEATVSAAIGPDSAAVSVAWPLGSAP